ncbi:MFS transporter [Amycolatopsis sp. La24]|uniref:MFS transporter n=1 Tax=Amycolatopsis sp. La24 TaxID=3028304 RepID=UPI0023B0BA17|nr:MFS transporter [Amycolatopsis sp. La24]
MPPPPENAYPHAKPVPSARWRRVGLLLFLVYFTAFAERANVSVAAPSIAKELHLSAAATGVVLSAFFWGYVATQVPGGWLATKLGPTRIIATSLFIWGFAAIAQALSGSIEPLLFSRLAMGLAEGVVWPTFAVMFVKWFPVGERARAAGLSLLALPASSVVMAPSAGWLIQTWNWQTMFVVQGVPAFILGVVVLVFLRDSPEQDRRLSETEREYILRHRLAHSDDGKRGSFLQVLKTPAVWACSLVYFLWLTGFYSFGLWLPTVLKELSARGIEAVGWLSAIPFAAAGVALLFNARAADRSRHGKSRFVIPALFLGAFGLLVQHFLPHSLLLQLAFLLITALGVYAAFGPWWAWALQYVPPEQAGPATGVINLFGSLGGLVGPVVVGYAANGGSTQKGFYALGFFMLASALVATAIASFGKRAPAAGPARTSAPVAAQEG